MKVRRRARALLAALTLAGLAACALGDRPLTALDPPVQLEPDQIIVALPLVAPSALAETARFLAQQYDLRLVTEGFPLSSIGLHCVVFQIRPGADPDAVVRQLSEHPGVSLAQRNQAFEVNSEPARVSSDPVPDPYAPLQHAPAEMRVDRVHRWATGHGVRVAIVDTGIDLGHADLRGRVVASRSFVQGGDASFSQDTHGTAVAGVLAANAGNGIGIYGVAPGAELVAAKACWHPDDRPATARCSSWTIARAFDYALEQQVQVINLSLGGPPDPLLERLLGQAAQRSIVVVAAAGPSPAAVQFPASHDSVLAVLESDSEGSAAPLDLKRHAVAAPGVEILTTAPGSAYRFESGSSLSTAHISGLVALLLEIDPSLTPDRVSTLLSRTARVSADDGTVAVADACNALQSLRNGGTCP